MPCQKGLIINDEMGRGTRTRHSATTPARRRDQGLDQAAVSSAQIRDALHGASRPSSGAPGWVDSSAALLGHGDLLRRIAAGDESAHEQAAGIARRFGQRDPAVRQVFETWTETVVDRALTAVRGSTQTLLDLLDDDARSCEEAREQTLARARGFIIRMPDKLTAQTAYLQARNAAAVCSGELVAQAITADPEQAVRRVLGEEEYRRLTHRRVGRDRTLTAQIHEAVWGPIAQAAISQPDPVGYLRGRVRHELGPPAS